MRRADFSYPLPDDLIANRPLPARGASRLLALDGATGAIRDLHFSDLGSLLADGDLLVLNDTRVLPARLNGRKASGGACELLLERVLGARRFLAQARASKGIRPGTRIELPAGAVALAVARRGDLHEFELDREVLPYFEAEGSVPLPPYVARDAEPADRERYQTVYAEVAGAVAAPTAGLHFDRDALARLSGQGIGTGIHYPIALHLCKAYEGLGFQPGDFPVAEQAAAQILSLPMFPGLTPPQQERVSKELLKSIELCLGGILAERRGSS